MKPISNILDVLIPARVKIRELKAEIVAIDEEYKRENIPKRWKPGLEYSSETEHLWDEKYGMPKLTRFPRGMSPDKTGNLKNSLGEGNK